MNNHSHVVLYNRACTYREIFESFDFHNQVDRLAKANLLYLVSEKFANIDLHPAAVSNAQMGAVFEELIRKFAELSNETAGEHFTPREVIRLMVDLIFVEDDDILSKPGVVRTIYRQRPWIEVRGYRPTPSTLGKAVVDWVRSGDVYAIRGDVVNAEQNYRTALAEDTLEATYRLRIEKRPEIETDRDGDTAR